MSGFDHAFDYVDFAREIAHGRRYVWTAATGKFLQGIRQTAPSRGMPVRETDSFWRAVDAVTTPQDLVQQFEFRFRPCPHSRIKPLQFRAMEGRVNPKGIPCLYVATDPKTAISEIRPALGFPLTLAKLKPTRPLRLVDCSRDALLHAGTDFSQMSQGTIELAVWGFINREFSVPVRRADDVADYAPTQLLAEVFKDMGYDGVAYRSAFGENGRNIAFFDPDALLIEDTWVYEVTGIHHEVQVVDDHLFPSSYTDRGAEPAV